MTQSGPKILVADDDEAMLDLIVRWLGAAGYSVVKAQNGEEALQAISSGPLTAIILDLSMPRMNGLQVLARFRVLGLPLPPVLMLTGHQSAEDVRKAVSLGVKDYLVKPVRQNELVSRLERMIGSHRSRATAASPAGGQSGSGEHYLD